MKRCLCLLLACIFLLCGCARENPNYWEQDVSQITPLLTAPPPQTPAEAEDVRAVWIPVMHYADWMTGRSEAAFRRTVQDVFADCADLGLNTVFLHVRAYADAYYDSALFPRGAYLTGDYDPLAVMTEEAHAQGLSVHAWINPLRCQTPEQITALDPACPIRRLYAEQNGTAIVCTEGRCWLDPAYPEVRQLVADGVSEILEHYEVEGIHIDDYFYPTQEEDFDASAFAESGSSDLAAFRRGNCDALVQLLYQTVKSHDPDCIFSISPQGNPDMNFDVLYADADKWASEPGYCDWIIPQLYYGFENSTCPFTETLRRWEECAVSARLIAGLAPYKIGLEDKWAGSGSLEWITNCEVLSQETALVCGEEAVGGIAYYSFNALFAPEASVRDLADAERDRIRVLLNG